MDRLIPASDRLPKAGPPTIVALLFGTAIAFAAGHDYAGIAGVLALSVLSLAYGAVQGLEAPV